VSAVPGILYGTAAVLIAVAILFFAVRGWKHAKRVEVGVGSALGSVNFVAEQMTPNGGASMRDAIDRIERKVDGLDDRLTAVEEAVTKP
jgi:uncharacterized protein (DUF2164 family)